MRMRRPFGMARAAPSGVVIFAVYRSFRVVMVLIALAWARAQLGRAGAAGGAENSLERSTCARRRSGLGLRRWLGGVHRNLLRLHLRLLWHGDGQHAFLEVSAGGPDVGARRQRERAGERA